MVFRKELVNKLVTPVLVVLAFLTATIVFYFVFSRSAFYKAPRVRGELQLPGISANVTVIRDSVGVPHIFASTFRDALFALGFVHAQDRRLQMELTRRYLRGELARLTGAAALSSDRLMRTLGLGRLAEEEVGLLSSEDRVLLEAYASGVNAAASNGNWPRDLLSRLLNVRGEPWTIADSLIILKMNTLSATHYEEELLASALISEVGQDRIRHFVPGDSQSTDYGVPSSVPGSLYAEWFNVLAVTLSASPLAVGSNSWVVHGDRTSTGSPYLASDPHMSLTAPSGVYAAHITCPEVEVTGIGIPGLPAFFHGHNRDIAWGVTLAGTDAQDLFIEQINGAEVRTPSGWEPLQVHDEQIQIRGSASWVAYQARASSHGPLISDADPSVLSSLFSNEGSSPKEGHHYALALANTSLRTTQPGWFFELIRAQEWSGFRQSLRGYSGTGYVFTYADIRGNIGYQLADHIPIRQGTTQVAIVPGWEDGHQWRGEIPFNDLPSALNPSEKLFVAANSRITDASSPLRISTHWEDLPWRANRIRKLLTAKPKSSLKDLTEIQLDLQQDSMEKVVGWAKMGKATGPEIVDFQRRLSNWDLKADVTSSQEAEAEVFRLELMSEVFRPHISKKLFDAYVTFQLFCYPALEKAMEDPNAELFGANPIEARTRRVEAVDRAIQRTRDRLKAAFGSDRSARTWGEVHQVEFRSPLLQGPALINWLFRRLNVGPFAAAGSNTTVNLAWWAPKELFAVRWGAGYRQVIDLGDFSRSLYLPPAPGQSGSPASRHYDDLAEPWAHGTYFPMAWTKEQVQREENDKLVLHPQTR
jgi:penicillin G amidase